MKTTAQIILASAFLLSTAVHAQGLTRAEVKQQLSEAYKNGYAHVTDSSYPEPDPRFMPQAPVKSATNGYGGVPAGTVESGTAPHGLPMPHGNPNCVGPVGFCDIYAGS